MKARTGLFLLVGSITTGTLCISNFALAWPTCSDGSVANQAENGRYVCPTPPQATSAANATAAAQAAAQANAHSNSESNANATLNGKVEGTVNGKIDNTSNQSLENSGNSKATGIGIGGTGGQGGQGGKGGAANANVGPVSATGGKSSSNLELENVGNSPSTSKAITGPVKTTVGGQKTAQQTTIDTSNRSVDNSKSMTVILPPVMPPMPPQFSQQGEVKQEVMACGPLQSIQRERIDGVFVGFTSNDNIYLGQDDRLIPFTQNGRIIRYHEEVQMDGLTVRVFGHQPIITTTPLTVSGARQFGLGGFNSNGGGQIGGGVSGAMGRLVSTIQLRDCELPGYKLVSTDPPVMVVPPPVVITPPPPQPEPPKKPKHKKKVVREFHFPPKLCPCEKQQQQK